MKTVAELRAELEKLNQQTKAVKELQLTRVSNHNMFKREMLETIIKGK